MLLSVVGIEVVAQSLKPVKRFTHVNTRNIVNFCVRFHVASSVSRGVSKTYTAMFRRTRHAKAQAQSKFSEESFWHKTHCLSPF